MHRFLVFFGAVTAWAAPGLWFEPNQGQAHPSVQFLAHSPGGYVYFGRNRMAVRDVRMDLVGARASALADLEEPLGGISSYFIGRDEKDWHTGIPQYGRVRYKNVYAGIDLVYYGNDRNVEYDFLLKPGADPNQIKLAYNKKVLVDANGDLLIAGLRQKRPKVYQNGREVACDYVLRERTVQLALADYDSSQALTVDPVLEFSTFLGGPAEEHGFSISLDTAGNVYLAGGTQSPAAPTLDPFQNTTALILSPVVLSSPPTDTASSTIRLSATTAGTAPTPSLSIPPAVQSSPGRHEFEFPAEECIPNAIQGHLG